MRSSRRFFFLLSAAVCGWVSGPEGVAQEVARVNPFVVPAQPYALIDLSGSSVGSNAVDQVALADDSKHAAFSYWNSPDYNNTDYLVGKWVDGALVEPPRQTGSTTTTYHHHNQTMTLTLGRLYERRLNSHGDVGTLGGLGPPADPAHPPVIGAEGAVIWPYGVTAVDALQPASDSWDHNDALQKQRVVSLGETGVLGGICIINSIYDSMWSTSRNPVFTASAASGCVECSMPASVSSVLFPAGYEYTVYYDVPTASLSGDYVLEFRISHFPAPNTFATCVVDTGGGWTQLALPYGYNTLAAFNDSHDVLVSSTSDPVTYATKGPYLFDKDGQKLPLKKDGTQEGLLPTLAQPHLRNFSSFLLSNRVPAPTDGSVKPVLHLLFRAEIERSPAIWTSGRFLLRLLSDGTTDLREVSYPADVTNVQPRSINSSGVIAASGTIGSDLSVKHALLLLPVEINCPEIYMFSGHANDVVELCKISGMTCEWKLKTATPTIGTFNHPTDSACRFTATGPGKNTIQLLVGGNVAWEKPIEVLNLKNRTAWGAEAADIPHMSGTMASVLGVTFHHSSNTNDGIAEIQRIQREHKGEGFPYNLPISIGGHENWGDIGYHFVMTKDGTVYLGRELEAAPGSPGGPYTLGSHVKLKNTPSGIGICLLGNYDTEAFSATHQKDLEKALTAICRRYKLTWDKVSYHTARAAMPPVYETTNCPGANMVSKAKGISDHVKENLP